MEKKEVAMAACLIILVAAFALAEYQYDTASRELAETKRLLSEAQRNVTQLSADLLAVNQSLREVWAYYIALWNASMICDQTFNCTVTIALDYQEISLGSTNASSGLGLEVGIVGIVPVIREVHMSSVSEKIAVYPPLVEKNVTGWPPYYPPSVPLSVNRWAALPDLLIGADTYRFYFDGADCRDCGTMNYTEIKDGKIINHTMSLLMCTGKVRLVWFDGANRDGVSFLVGGLNGYEKAGYFVPWNATSQS